MTLPLVINTSATAIKLQLSDMPCPVLITDTLGAIQLVNQELLDIVDGTVATWTGQPMDALLTKASCIFAQTHVWPMLMRELKVREIYLQLRATSQAPVPVMTNARWILDGDREYIIWLLFVAAERSRFEAALLEARKRAETITAELTHDKQELTHLSLTDSLTGLGNRRALDAAGLALARDGRTPLASSSLMMIDVDHFKRVNDQWGHDKGDQVLTALGECLKRCARDRDTVVRYGGEEFVLLLPHTDPARAELIAQRLHAEIHVLLPAGIAITISIGVASGSIRGSDDLSQLITRADAAVYEAKHQGRSCTRVAAPLAGTAG
jgi:two-component system cell cycle response regulator